jgi:hypothetical protein
MEVVIIAILSMSQVDSSVDPVPVSDAFSTLPCSITLCGYHASKVPLTASR